MDRSWPDCGTLAAFNHPMRESPSKTPDLFALCSLLAWNEAPALPRRQSCRRLGSGSVWNLDPLTSPAFPLTLVVAMPDRSKKRPRDPNQLAHQVMLESTGQAEKYQPDENPKNPHAVALGRLGGLKGGAARAASLSANNRSRIAKKAAQKRWAKKA